MTRLTAEQIFFRYAWPCAEIRLERGDISEEQYRILKFFRENPDRKPDRRLLAACFPNAVKDLVETSHRMLSPDLWVAEHVAEYWRHHHQGPSPVKILTVEEIYIDHIDAKDDSGKDFFLWNPFNIEVKIGDRITAHVHNAIEKLYRSE